MENEKPPIPKFLKELCNAIKNKEILSIKYSNKYRIIEPYIVGLNTNTNNYLVSAYYVDAKPDKNNHIPQYWRTFEIDKIQIVTRQRKNFIVRLEYTGQHPSIDEIICSIQL